MPFDFNLTEPSDRQRCIRLIKLLNVMLDKKRQRMFYELYPDETKPKPKWLDALDGDTIHAREGYKKHLEFFRVGKDYRERCFLAGNRTGKTFGGGYEVTCHLTGLYPDWWEGRRFDRPIRAWACGKTNETTRDIVQQSLVGSVIKRANNKRVNGHGLIPGELLDYRALSWKQGVQDLIDTVGVKHVSGGISKLGFKSYQQGRSSFEGTAQHVILLDEEPPMDVYGECVIRTATTNGVIMLTFTPLEGMSEVVMSFLDLDLNELKGAKDPMDQTAHALRSIFAPEEYEEGLDDA